MSDGGVVAGPDGLARCPWGLSAPDYAEYHDTEWGRPVHGEAALYERLSLEAFQSGLSWITILRRREGFRKAFAGFSPEAVAAFTDEDRARLLADTGIIRNRAKIDAAIANADATLARARPTRRSGRPGLVVRAGPRRTSGTPHGRGRTGRHGGVHRAGQDLKKRGFRFVGPTTAYALMQACGLVDDHLAGCCARR